MPVHETAFLLPTPGNTIWRKSLHWLRRWVALWEQPVWSALLALVVYSMLGVRRTSPWSVTSYAYYNYLADAFLHGQLYLRVPPLQPHDLSFYNGHYYLYWGPFPAVLLMPFVAVFGLRFSDVIFTLGIAALNVGLVALLLRQACAQKIVVLSVIQRAWLVLFFALGTVHVTLAPFGRVWFTGQVLGFLCVVLAYIFTLSQSHLRAFAMTGMALAAALLTRSHLVLTGLWPAYYLLYQHRTVGWRNIVSYVLVGITPVILAIAVTGAYNWLRFGSAFDNGLAYHAMAPRFVTDFLRYGAFDLHYVPTNMFYQYVAYPYPLGPDSFQGASLFLLSPVFVASIWGVIRGRPRLSTCAMAGTIALVATPILLLMGTGWVQFGPRYTLDFTVPLLLLTAIGIRYWPVWIVAALTVVSLAHYLTGIFYFSIVI